MKRIEKTSSTSIILLSLSFSSSSSSTLPHFHVCLTSTIRFHFHFLLSFSSRCHDEQKAMRNDGDQYANLQRLNSAVLARYQWTSSLIGMQKTPEEIHQRRNRNHRKVNEFIQELIGKRSDINALDDQGALERYRQFQMRHKIDDDDLFDEFNRRLRSLTRYPRTFRPTRRSSLQTANSTSTIDIQTDDFDTTGITDRVKQRRKQKKNDFSNFFFFFSLVNFANSVFNRSNHQR